VITEDGLNTVKKMLRQTASKSTAVSCHWIRSRSRSELIWVVGNRSQFDDRGVVPVNSTSQQIIIGETEVMVDKILANTKGQRLDQHLFAVAYVAYKIITRLVPNDSNLAIAVFIAGVWHDIGKIDPEFQKWLQGSLKKNHEEIPDEGQHIDKKTGAFSWQKYPRHNEISLLLLHLLFNSSKYPEVNERIKHAVYWHHAKPIRDKGNEITAMVGIFNKWSGFEQSYPHISTSVVALFKSIQQMMSDNFDEGFFDKDMLEIPKFDGIEDRLEPEPLPKYKRYSSKESLAKYQGNIQHNALNNLARSALVTADRLVSREFTGESLDEAISNCGLDEILDQAFHKDRGLNAHIKQCLEGFSQNNPEVERNRQQSVAAQDLADEEVRIGVLRGPAGCGKTKIALEWALKTNAKKIFWVCPRVQVCQGLFYDLTSSDYLPDARVEICTGEIKHIMELGEAIETPEGKEFSGDVVITTIDQIINSITTHRNVTTLISFMDAHVVFDEFHEYINMPAFNLLFAELVECKKRQQEDDTLPNTLLVSATPNHLFVKEFLQISGQDVIGIRSFNNSKYRIEFIEYDEKKEDESNPLYAEQPPNTFVISNTAITAQKSFIDRQNDENGILLHSKFKKSDREDLFQKALSSFKKDGNREYDVLRSGPVVQAALNITCDKMVSEMSHAENFLQRMGRLDRFGQNDSVNQYRVAITDDVKRGKSKSASARFLNQLNSLQSTKAWFEFLQNELPENNIITVEQMYGIYDQFYESDLYLPLLEQDMISALKESVIRINNNVVDPVTLPSFKKEEGKVKIKKHSLRGDNRFVQMAVVQMDNRQRTPVHLNIYLDEVMTYETNKIEGVFGGQRKPDMDLLAYMYKKDHKIQSIKMGETIRKRHSVNIIKNEARDPDCPIYLSYTLADLKLCNDHPNLYAIYYAIGVNQPIGAISLQQFNQQGEEQ